MITFTPRQLDYLDEIAKGYERQTIARHLGVCPSSVDMQRIKIRKKIGLINRQRLKDWLVDNGWDCFYADGTPYTKGQRKNGKA